MKMLSLNLYGLAEIVLMIDTATGLQCCETGLSVVQRTYQNIKDGPGGL